MQKKLLFTILAFLLMTTKLHAQNKWSIEGNLVFNLDIFGISNLKYVHGSKTSGYLSPNIRIANRINNKWELFAGIQYFNKTDRKKAFLEPYNLEASSPVFHSMFILTDQQSYKGMSLSLGARYYFAKISSKIEMYAIAAATNRATFHAAYKVVESNFVFKTQSFSQLGLGLEMGCGAQYRLNKQLGIRLEGTFMPIEYQNEKYVLERNGFKGLSHAAIGLGLSYAF